MCFKFGNIVPQAILIRAIKPEIGIETMLKRRNKTKVIPSLTNGPSYVCQALGITREHDGFFLDGKHIWLEDRGFFISDENILQSARIGVDYAEKDALKPWRFYI